MKRRREWHIISVPVMNKKRQQFTVLVGVKTRHQADKWFKKNHFKKVGMGWKHKTEHVNQLVYGDNIIFLDATRPAELTRVYSCKACFTVNAFREKVDGRSLRWLR